MKKIEMDTVTEIIMNTSDKPDGLTFELIFMDSKAAGHELLQMADILAGIGRRFFEETLNNNDFQQFIRVCTACNNFPKKLNLSCNLPKYKKIKRSILNEDVKYLQPFFINNSSRATLKGISMFPSARLVNYGFLDCYKIKSP